MIPARHRPASGAPSAPRSAVGSIWGGSFGGPRGARDGPGVAAARVDPDDLDGVHWRFGGADLLSHPLPSAESRAAAAGRVLRHRTRRYPRIRVGVADGGMVPRGAQRLRLLSRKLGRLLLLVGVVIPEGADGAYTVPGGQRGPKLAAGDLVRPMLSPRSAARRNSPGRAVSPRRNVVDLRSAVGLIWRSNVPCLSASAFV